MVSMSDFESSSEQTPLIEDNVQIFYGQECIGKGKLSISDEYVTYVFKIILTKSTFEACSVSVFCLLQRVRRFSVQSLIKQYIQSQLGENF